MTTYWVSNARHWCKECKCWMDAKPSSIRRHEEGFRHKGNVDRLLKKLKRDKILAGRESTKHASEIAAIERAAKKAYIKDCANGNASIGLTFNKNKNRYNSNTHSKRKDNKLFLPSDNDTYYYMDKSGITHGPYSSFQMCKWYHFGFFVGALRIRKREQSIFMHLRDITNPFSHKEFEYKLNTNIHFKNNIINSIDISNSDCVPPGIEIPETLKNEFYKKYPKISTNKSNDLKSINKPIQHKYYSDGVHFINENNNNVSINKKQQRRIFVRGQMRKYKSKCNCGDSDCHIKHNNNYKSEDYNEEMNYNNDNKYDKIEENNEKDKVKEIKSDKSEIETIIDKNKDELGFGKWETITKAEFDKKHSNEKLFKEREKQMGKKRKWWRQGVNKNLPIAKRKKLMGIDNMDSDSDNERDFDDEYGINEILKWKQENNNNNNNNNNNAFIKGYKESKDKINISISGNINMNNNNNNNVNDNDIIINKANDLNDDDVMVKDAKMKLIKIKENEKKIEKEKKNLMIEQLNKDIIGKCDGKKEKHVIDSEMLGSLFKKKKKRKKKKNRQNMGIVSNMS